jgi:cytochrome c
MVQRFALAMVLLFLAAWPAAAETLVDTGKRLVGINCTRCHATGPTGDSPFRPAPPFREVAKNYTAEELTDGFMEGLAVRHPAMPEWHMTLPQAEAITAYIMSLRAPGESKADDSPVIAGYHLLQKNCARCHAIGRDGLSPNAKAPPFRDVVKRYAPSSLEEALAEGIVTGHNEMPEFTFDPDEVSAIIAYLQYLGN